MAQDTATPHQSALHQPASQQSEEHAPAVSQEAKLHRATKMARDALAKGDLSTARTLYRALVAKSPQFREGWFLLGEIEQRLGSLDQAEACYRQCHTLDSSDSTACARLGSLLIARGDLMGAEKIFRAMVRINPRNLKGWLALGQVLIQGSQYQKAEEAFNAAAKIDPSNPSCHHALGLLALRKNDRVGAERAFRDVIAISPMHRATFDLAELLSEDGRQADAKSLYRQLLRIKPHDHDMLCSLAALLEREGDLPRAIGLYQRILEHTPEDPQAVASLVDAAQRICDWDTLLKWRPVMERQTRKALEAAQQPGETPRLSLFHRTNPKHHLAIARTWSRTVQRRMEPVANRLGPIPQKETNADDTRIHLAYLLNSFHSHPSTRNILGVLRNHDRKHFRISVYSCDLDDRSRERQEIAPLCDQFVNLRHTTPYQAVQRLRQDGADILIGLLDHSDKFQFEIATLRPAPLQISWLTFPGSTGSAAFDYLIGDPVVTPETDDKFFSESIIRLPHTYWPMDNAMPSITEQPNRATLGLPVSAPVFAAFHPGEKIDQPTFEAWMQILHNVKDSVLWMLNVNSDLIKALCRHAELRRISPNRLIFAEAVPEAQHQQRLAAADLGLDTRHYNGHTTTADCLWAGVPVLTALGSHFAARVSHSLVQATQVDGLETFNLDIYVEKAINLARSPEHLAYLRQRLIAARATAPLFDTPRFVKNLETALTTVWQRHLANESPSALTLLAG